MAGDHQVTPGEQRQLPAMMCLPLAPFNWQSCLVTFTCEKNTADIPVCCHMTLPSEDGVHAGGEGETLCTMLLPGTVAMPGPYPLTLVASHLLLVNPLHRSLQSQMGKYRQIGHTPLTTTTNSSSSSNGTGTVPVTTLALHLVSRGMPLLPPPAPSSRQRAQAGGWAWWQTLPAQQQQQRLPVMPSTAATKGKGGSLTSSSDHRASTAAAAELAVSNWHKLQTGPGLGLEAYPSCSWQQQDVRGRDVTSTKAPCGCTAALSATALASLSSSSVGLWGFTGSPGSSSSKALGSRVQLAASAAGPPRAALTAVAVRSTAGDVCCRLAGVTQELVTAGAFCHWWVFQILLLCLGTAMRTLIASIIRRLQLWTTCRIPDHTHLTDLASQCCCRYERYGCSKHMLLEAAQALEEVGSYYQLQAQAL